MRLLAATREMQDGDESDFDTGIAAGEIVEPTSVCDKDLHNDWPGRCGCGRAFVGMSSGKLTTTAIVADLEVERDQLHALIAEHHADADADECAAMTEQLIEYGGEHDVGTVVRIWQYELQVRP